MFDAETVTAVRHQVAMQLCLSERALRFSVERDAFLQTYVVRALVEGLAHPEHSESVPDDWWQAFKERWFPGWALSRWPVKTRKIATLRFCPHLNVPDPTHVSWLSWEAK